VVQRGQFLERPALIKVGDYLLDGLSHRGKRHPPLLILPPRPGEGPGMDHPLCAEIAWVAATAGFPTLRFNFRGVGASQGKRSGPQTDLEDADAAVRLLMENAAVASAAALGISGSAATVLELFKLHPGLSGICLVQPVEDVVSDLPRLSIPLLLVIGEADSSIPSAALVASAAEAGGRVEMISHLDAGLGRGLSDVARAVVRWLEAIGP
jgi:uncharacterized protein